MASSSSTLRLSLDTIAGAVNIDGPTPVWVIDGDDSREFILGNDVLAKLGIGVDRQLELLASPVLDEPDALDVEACIERSNSDDPEIQTAMQDMINRALKEGTPLSELDRLTVIVGKY